MWNLIWFLLGISCIVWVVLLMIKYKTRMPEIIITAIAIETILLFVALAKPFMTN